jgi:hypothetical protein
VTTQDVTPNEIEEWLHANKKKGAWLAQTLGVTKPTIGRWLRGQEIPEPMQHLLKLLVRGELPPGFSKPHDPAVLAFTPDEWRVIEILRIREGFPDAKSWVVAKIRSYLAMLPKESGVKGIKYPTSDEEEGRFEHLRVAEGPEPKRGNGTEGN